jgi:VWFA-related protein
MRFRIVLGLALALGSSLGDDQQQPERRLVNLNVIAVDNHGEPVTDLTADDFQVADAGKPQKIAFFHHTDGKLWQVPALKPNEFSNRKGANIPFATVILLDLLNERFGTSGTAWNELVHSLERLETADYLYLYLLTVTGQVYPVHGLPGAEAEAARPEEQPWTRQAKPLLDEAMRKVAGLKSAGIDVAVRVPLTYRALNSLAGELSSVPGRKNIVWITDGVPLVLGPARSDTGQLVDFTPQLRQLTEGLERSGIAVYPVQQVFAGSRLESADTLDEFAGLTGGRPDAGKDIGAAIEQSMKDLRTGYQIAYYPPVRNWDGKFHKLRVTSTRKGVRIQAKTGYYAWPEPPGARARAAIEAVWMTTFDAAEIGLRASLSRDPNDGHLWQLAGAMNADDVALAQQNGLYTGQLETAFVSYLTDGRTESSDISSMDLRLSAQERDQVQREGIRFARNVTIGENVKTVRFIVFDHGSGAIGSISIPVKAAGERAQP